MTIVWVFAIPFAFVAVLFAATGVAAYRDKDTCYARDILREMIEYSRADDCAPPAHERDKRWDDYAPLPGH